MRRPSRHAGFVLLMVLVLVLLAATVLAATARHALSRNVAAGAAQRELQRRWGARSCRDAFLARAEVLLTEAVANDPVEIKPFLRRSITLGRMTFDVTLADEQAKADVNRLAEDRGKEGLASALRALQSGQTDLLEVALRPTPSARPAPASRSTRRRRSRAARIRRRLRREPAQPPAATGPAYGSFDQVFAFNHPRALFGQNDAPAVADRITFWTDGRLNYRRAERNVLREALAPVLGEGEIALLVDFRERHPDGTLGEALRRLKLTKRQRDALGPLLTDASGCHSVRIVTRGQTRDWIVLYVAPAGSDAATSTWSFEW